MADAVNALVSEEGVVGDSADGGDVLLQVRSAARGEEGLGRAVERPRLALVAGQRERRRAELLVCRASEIVGPLVAVHLEVAFALLQELDRLLRAVSFDESCQEHVVLYQTHVVIRRDFIRRLELAVGDLQDERYRGGASLTQGHHQPANLRREVVVEAPEPPRLEGKGPRLSGRYRPLRVQLGEDRVGWMDVGGGPERFVGSIDESDLTARFDVETLGDKAAAGIDDLRCV